MKHPRFRSILTVTAFLALFCFLSFDSGGGPAAAEDAGSDNPIEAGKVHWNRDLDAMLAQSRESGKPLFVLFQEIPGCSGCRAFGRQVLSQPLLVEAIESEFLPVLVYNNRSGGPDEENRRRFGEPGWNYQVIRFLDGDGRDILPRKDKVWNIAGVAGRMVQALEKLQRPVPLYLRNLALEFDVENHARVAFAMACFWTGEYKLGRPEGVVATETGWYDHREVTLVTYHKKRLDLERLVEYAAKQECARRVYLLPGDRVKNQKLTIKPFEQKDYRKAPPSDQKKQLGRWSQLASITDLTPLQLTKLNSFVPHDRKKALRYLSPRQRKQLVQQ